MPLIVENIGKEIIIFERDEEGRLHSKRIRNFAPYFYVETNEDPDTYAIDGTPVKKVVVRTPSEVRAKREEFMQKGLKVYEADVEYTRRFLIDRYETPLKKEPFRYVFLDIEVLDSLDVEHTPAPIVCVTLYDSFTRTYYTHFYYRRPVKLPKEDNWIIKQHLSERLLIKNVIKDLITLNPDLIATWNVSYDLIYLYNRINKVDAMLYDTMVQLSRIPEKRVRIGFEKQIKKTQGKRSELEEIELVPHIKIPGRHVLDYMILFSNLVKMRPDYRISLNEAGQEVGVEKIQLTESISEMYQKGRIVDILEYNKRDVEIMVAIEGKIGLLQFLDEMRRYVGLAWNHIRTIPNYSRSVLADTLILRYTKKKGIVLPNKKKINVVYRGAEVFEPKPGVHQNIYVLDYKSLYPSIIITFSISPFTLVENPKGIQNKITIEYLEGNQKKTETVGFELKDNLVSEIILNLFNERKKYKDLMKQAIKEGREEEAKEYNYKQLAIKNLLNSFYGIMGSKKSASRIADVKCAGAVTGYERWIIHKTREIIESMGYEVIYGDTDSCFIKIPQTTTDIKARIELGERLANEITKRLAEEIKKEFDVTSYIVLEFKQLYEKVVFERKETGTLKKRYFGLLLYDEAELSEPKIEIKGYLRGDNTPFLNESLKLIVETYLTQGLKAARKLWRQRVLDLLAGKFELTKILPVKNWHGKKNSNVYRGIKKAKERGIIDVETIGKYYLVRLTNGDWLAIPNTVNPSKYISIRDVSKAWLMERNCKKVNEILDFLEKYSTNLNGFVLQAKSEAKTPTLSQSKT